MELKQAARDPWVWGQVVLLAAILLGVPLLVPREAGPHRGAGLVLVLAGLALGGWGILSLRRWLTPSVVPPAEGELLVHGPYRYIRHPMYAGVTLAVTGYGMLAGTWWSGVIAGLLALAYVDRKASAEERHLAARFPEYSGYRARVSKWVPRLRRRAD